MHALITGAAGAIGSEIARELHNRRVVSKLTLVDKNGGGMSAVAVDTQAEKAVWDLSKPADLAAAVAALSPVDLLVNCAGIMDMTSLHATRWEDAMRLLDIDLVSPLRLMQLCVPGMVARKSGGVINVSSMAGVTPLRGGTFYGAAKAGLAMASEVARLELEPRGVTVVTVYPGPVRSDLEKNARGQLERSFISELIPMGDARELARLCVDAFVTKKARVVYPPLYALANRLPRIAGAVTSWLSPDPLR